VHISSPVLPHGGEEILSHDIGRVLAATACQLTTRERTLYMNPVQNVFKDCAEIELLTKAGVNIVLLGQHVHLLKAKAEEHRRFYIEIWKRFHD
jgi:hypothetical protein